RRRRAVRASARPSRVAGGDCQGPDRAARPRRPGLTTKGAIMSLPFEEPLVARAPGAREIPEPPRRGEPGGPPCGICTGKTTSAVWSDENWTLHPPVGGSLPGAVWLASRVHVDSFSELPEELAADFGRVAARVGRAILARGDVGRV